MDLTLKTFFSNPIVIAIGWLGGIASIISIPLSLYLASPDPKLIYHYDEDSFLSVFNRGNATKLHVYYEDPSNEIENDLSFVKIKVWNSGRKEIRESDIREPINISSPSDIQILEVSVPEDEKQYIVPSLNKGVVNLSFTILEPSEGNTVQVMYIGKKQARFEMRGKIVGQQKIFKWYALPRTWFGSAINYVFMLFALVGSLSFILGGLYSLLSVTLFKLVEPHRYIVNIANINEKYGVIFQAGMVILMVIFGTWFWLSKRWLIPI